MLASILRRVNLHISHGLDLKKSNRSFEIEIPSIPNHSLSWNFYIVVLEYLTRKPLKPLRLVTLEFLIVKTHSSRCSSSQMGY